LVVAEDDAEQDTPALALQVVRDRSREPAVQAIAQAAEPAAVADDPPGVAFQDDMDAVPPEPRSLVESMAGAARELRLCSHFDDCALRRRPAERKLELRRLIETEQSEPADADRDLEVEAAAPRLTSDDNRSALRAADLIFQDARVEAVEPGAPPPPAGQSKRTGDRAGPVPGARGEDRGA
jgi:hypothetical protein